MFVFFFFSSAKACMSPQKGKDSFEPQMSERMKETGGLGSGKMHFQNLIAQCDLSILYLPKQNKLEKTRVGCQRVISFAPRQNFRDSFLGGGKLVVDLNQGL